MKIDIVPLHADFAAEIRGVGLIDVAASHEAYEAVRAAFEQHSVLVFRDQEVSDDIQATFSRAFGPLERTKVGTLGEGTFYVRLTNLDPEGRIVADSDRQVQVARANALWHTDSSFKTRPALASVLSARVLPDGGSQTQFASTRAAWERLAEDERERLLGLVVEHSYVYSRRQVDPTLVTSAELSALPPVRWRMTWPNPVNGRHALYIASHAGAIDGLSAEEGTRLLATLMERATLPEHVYTHQWRAGDVLMWDNRAVVHRGPPPTPGRARSMVRTTVTATEADGVGAVRP